MSKCIFYMWNFNPNETNQFFIYNKNVINNNIIYINNYQLIEPKNINILLNNLQMIKTKPLLFPTLYKLYDIIPNWISKSDLARLLIIYHYSGIYCDVDCFIKKSFEKYSKEYNVILFTEYICRDVNELGIRECKKLDNKVRIANYFFYSKIKNHPFVKEVIDECLRRLEQIIINENKNKFNNSDILWCCGPDVITTIYHSTKHKYKDIYLCDTSFLNHKCYGSWRT